MKLLEIKSPEKWCSDFKDILLDVFGKEHFNSVSTQVSEIYCDDSCWMDKGTEFEGESFSYISKGLKNAFTHVVGYHACKPYNMDRYFNEGLKPTDIAHFTEHCLERFKGSQITRNDIVKALSEINCDRPFGIEKGKLYFNLFEELLLNEAGHYLVYGGELLHSLAYHLKKTFPDLQVEQFLLSTGIPTIFKCAIPIIPISDNTLKELAGFLACRFFVNLNKLADTHRDNFGFAVEESIPPENIISHVHPNTIYNPITGCFTNQT